MRIFIIKNFLWNKNTCYKKMNPSHYFFLSNQNFVVLEIAILPYSFTSRIFFGLSLIRVYSLLQVRRIVCEVLYGSILVQRALL